MILTKSAHSFSLVLSSTEWARCPPTHQRAPLVTSLARDSLEEDDTDDEYYFRLMQQEIDEDEIDNDEIGFELPIDTTTLAVERSAPSINNTRQETRQMTEYVMNRDAVEQRKMQRKQVKRSRRLQNARKMALGAMGLDKPPALSKQRRQYHATKGLYSRFLEVIEIRQSQAYERARIYVVDREAALAAANDKTNNRQVAQLDYLKSIESMRQQEASRTRIMTELALATSSPKEGLLEELSNEDLIAVLRIRGNIKGARRHFKRETILGLLRRSFKTPLY